MSASRSWRAVAKRSAGSGAIARITTSATGAGSDGARVARIVDPARLDGPRDLRIGPVVGARAGQALVEDDAGRIDVAAAILGVAADPLRRGVAVLADEDRREGRARRGPGGAEVDQLGRAAGRDDHVVGAEIAMDEAQRAVPVAELVNVVQRLADVDQDVQRGGDRQEIAAREHPLVREAQRDAGDVLHGDEVAPLELTEVEDVGDVRVAERRRQRRFIDEHLDEIRAPGQLRQHRLDDDPLLEPAHPLELGAPDLGHAARRQPRVDLVSAEVCACLPRRRRRVALRKALARRRAGDVGRRRHADAREPEIIRHRVASLVRTRPLAKVGSTARRRKT